MCYYKSSVVRKDAVSLRQRAFFMNRVIITGPTGAIGVAFIQECISRGTEVFVVVRPNSKRKENIPQDKLVHIIECDLSQLASLPERIKERDFDAFYHLGWDGTFGNSRNNMSGQLQNIQYTLDAVQTAKKLGCKRFVGAGSQAEYGRCEEKLHAMTPTFPENGYGIAKLCAGQMSRIQCEQEGLEHIWTRILSIYGPYDGENTMIMSTIRTLLKKDKPSTTKGEQQWDYLYAKDAGLAMYLLGEKGISGKTYCIGSGRTRQLKEYITAIRDYIEHIYDENLPIGIGERPYADKQVMYLCADITDLERDTGFAPRYEFEDGIAETIEWVKQHYEEN